MFNQPQYFNTFGRTYLFDHAARSCSASRWLEYNVALLWFCKNTQSANIFDAIDAHMWYFGSSFL